MTSSTHQTLLDALQELLPNQDPTERFQALHTYASLLVHHNRTSNLIGPHTVDSVLDDLLLDSILPALIAPPQGPLADIGSGAGLPGIPLALALPTLSPVHLIEPRLKRTTFLSIMRRKLALQDRMTIHRERVEHFQAVPAGSWNTLAAKAFQPPHLWLDTASKLLASQGLVYLYLTQDSWDTRAQEIAEKLSFVELGRREHPTRPERFAMVMRFDG